MNNLQLEIDTGLLRGLVKVEREGIMQGRCTGGDGRATVQYRKLQDHDDDCCWLRCRTVTENLVDSDLLASKSTKLAFLLTLETRLKNLKIHFNLSENA